MIFRPHPANRKLPEAAAAIAAIHKLLRADAEATSRPHRWGAAADRTFAELANAADAMVADVSGVVTDFMQSLKPFAMVATGDKTDTFRARFPSSRSAYVIEWDLSTLDDALDAMLGDDPLAPIRVERRKYYLGGYENGESARAFVSYLQSLTADPTPIEAVPAKPPVTLKFRRSVCSLLVSDLRTTDPPASVRFHGPVPNFFLVLVSNANTHAARTRTGAQEGHQLVGSGGVA